MLADEEVETPGDTRGDAQALVDTLAESQGEVAAEMLRDNLSDAQELLNTMADSLA